MLPLALSANIESIQVGLPQQFNPTATTSSNADAPENTWTSAIIKQVVSGPVKVRQTNLEGDAQADLVHHGGVDKAVLVYAAEHYPFWQAEFPDVAWGSGSFGENLTLRGAVETDVCIGDIFRSDDCLLQVSQPRQPCWKLSRRWQLPKLAVRVQKTRLTGWYLRVIEEGVLEAGQAMQLVERPFPEWTVQTANDIMYAKPRNAHHDRELAACPLLSDSWRQTLQRSVLR